MSSDRDRRETEAEPTVLVVAQDREERGRVGAWLEEAGFSVMMCSGPTEPDYVCLAGRSRTCPIAEEADAVVLDLWLAGDTVMRGMSGNELLTYYLSRGKPVVTLSHGRETATLQADDQVTPIAYPPEREKVLAAVAQAVWPYAPHVPPLIDRRAR